MTTKKKPLPKHKPKGVPTLPEPAGPTMKFRRFEKLPPVMCPLTPRLTVCQEADALVNGPRQADYGDPRANFTRWRDMARATGRPGLAAITGEDLAILMVILKICRDTGAPKRDNAVDGAGYFDLLDRVRGV